MGYPSVLTRQDLGLLRRAVQGQAVQVPAPLRQLRDGERAVQDLLPGRVPRADRGRMRDDAARQLVRGPPATTSRRSPSARTRPHPHHRQEGPARQSGRPRPLHPVHGRGAADLRPPHRRGLRGRVAADPRIDALRDKMVCVEDPQFTRDYHDPDKRSIANGITVEFKDGTQLNEVVGRVSDRPPPPAQGRHPAAGREVQDQPRAPLSAEKQQEAILDVALDQRSARGDAGARVRRPVRYLISSSYSPDEALMKTRSLRSLASFACAATAVSAAVCAADIPDAQVGPVGSHPQRRRRERQGPERHHHVPRRSDPGADA